MERYNFHAIEKKWRAKLNNKKLENKKAKILLSRNVSLSIRQNTYGSR